MLFSNKSHPLNKSHHHVKCCLYISTHYDSRTHARYAFTLHLYRRSWLKKIVLKNEEMFLYHSSNVYYLLVKDSHSMKSAPNVCLCVCVSKRDYFLSRSHVLQQSLFEQKRDMSARIEGSSPHRIYNIILEIVAWTTILL